MEGVVYMIKHIVMWNVKDNVNGNSKLESSKLVKERLEDLKSYIEEIVSLEVGINIVEGDQAKDLVLNSEFASLEDLDIYQKHPAHVEAVKFASQFLESRVVIDYEV